MGQTGAFPEYQTHLPPVPGAFSKTSFYPEWPRGCDDRPAASADQQVILCVRRTKGSSRSVPHPFIHRMRAEFLLRARLGVQQRTERTMTTVLGEAKIKKETYAKL